MLFTRLVANIKPELRKVLRSSPKSKVELISWGGSQGDMPYDIHRRRVVCKHDSEKWEAVDEVSDLTNSLDWHTGQATSSWVGQ